MIPRFYNGLPVTGIDGNAFIRFTSIESVVIPNTVTTLNGYAFEGCTSLYNVMILSEVFQALHL